MLFVTFSHGKSEPTKAEVGIVGDIIALGVACVCGWEGKTPRNEDAHAVSAERLKTREASVKQ